MPTIATAMERLHRQDRSGIEAAVLDIQLGTETAFPIADELVSATIPFVFYTGHARLSIPRRFSRIGRVEKPSSVAELAAKLAVGSVSAPGSRSASGFGNKRDKIDVVALLPRLRWAARRMTGDARLADSLVEEALHLALGRVDEFSEPVSLEKWLMDLVDVACRQRSGPDRRH